MKKIFLILALICFAVNAEAAQLKDTIIDNDLTITTGGTIIYEGTTADDFELTVDPGDPTADRTWTYPDATDTFVGKATTDAFTNKTITDGTNAISATQLTTGSVPAARVAADHIDAITEIAAALKTGADGTLATGTAGASTELAEWNADGDTVGAGAILGTLTDENVCEWEATGTFLICDTPKDASGACAAGSICAGGHTHAGSGTWFIPFYVQSAKVTGADITAGGRIDAGQRPWRFLLDDTTEQSKTYQFVVDPNYAAGTATLEILFSMDTTQSGDKDVKFDGKFMCTTGGDAEDFNTDGFDTEQSVTHDLATTQTADHPRKATITFTQTQADEMAVDDICRFFFNRDPAVAADATGDVQILGLLIHE